MYRQCYRCRVVPTPDVLYSRARIHVVEHSSLLQARDGGGARRRTHVSCYPEATQKTRIDGCSPWIFHKTLRAGVITRTSL